METKGDFLGRVAKGLKVKTTIAVIAEETNYQIRITVTQLVTILVFITVSSAMAVCSSDRGKKIKKREEILWITNTESAKRKEKLIKVQRS